VTERKKSARKPRKPSANALPRAQRRDTPGAIVRAPDSEAFHEWDDEELARGQRRNKNGQFRGRPPATIPFEIHKELTRRRFARAHDLLGESLADAAQMLRSIVKDESADVYARLRAADMIFDRILGKPRESVDIGLYAGPAAEKPYQKMLQSAIVSTAGEAMDLLERQREDELRQAVHGDGEVVDVAVVRDKEAEAEDE